MSIPNISDYFRSQQQHQAALAEQGREFNEAKDQRNQQFWSSMFLDPLLKTGFGLAGHYAQEQMPTESAMRKGVELQNVGTDDTNDWNKKKYGGGIGGGLVTGASPEPVPLGPKALNAPSRGPQSYNDKIGRAHV